MSTTTPFTTRDPFAPDFAQMANALHALKNQVTFLAQRVLVLESRQTLHMPLQPHQPMPVAWPCIQWPLNEPSRAGTTHPLPKGTL